ncbi:MAG: EF-P lysine aminoacylase EpmA [Chloroflexota bacterium]
MTLDDEPRRLAGIKPNLERRAVIYQFIREFFSGEGCLEVETPTRTPAVAPEAHIVPFGSEGWFLSTSPELYMKRLLASGYDRLFQISRCFRKDEAGKQHNPEFTMLEWYRVGADYRQMIADTERLVVTLAGKLGLGNTITYKNQRIDITLPWPAITVREAFQKAAGWNPVTELDAVRFDLDLVEKVMPSFIYNRPTVLLDYPAQMASLARLKPGKPEIAERAEVFIGGMELANAYSELTDSVELEKRFKQESAQIRKAGRRIVMPRQFLKAMPYLPECGGIALGVDRLVMLFCNAESISEVIAFPEPSDRA